MEEKIYQFLVKQLGNTSVSERTIRRKAAKLAKTITTDEQLTAEAVADDVEDLKEWSGEKNHEVSEQVNKFKKEYKPQPKPEEDTADTELEKLKQQVADMQKSLEAKDKESLIASIRLGVLNKAEELKISKKAVWKDCVNGLNLTNESTSESVLADAKKAYEQKVKDYFGDGATPYSTTSKAEETSNDAIDGFFARKAEQGKFPKKE